MFGWAMFQSQSDSTNTKGKEMSYHKVTIVGNLGGAPEMRFTPGGQAVTNLNVATNRLYTSANGERMKETTWFRVSAWGSQAELCNKYLKSGDQVMIEGRMNADKDTGGPRVYVKKDGANGANYEITAERVVFLGGNKKVEEKQDEFPDTPPTNDEIPF